MKQHTKKILGGVLLLLLIAGMLFAYATFREKPVEGAKIITIEVINQAQKKKSYEVHTDAPFLKGAMEDAKDLTFSGTEGEYGLTLETVNGETANFDTDSAYWCIMVNGEYGNYGVDSQPIEDGDVFQLIYTVY